MKRFVILSIVMVSAQAAFAGDPHKEDFEVGYDPATNSIRVEFDPDVFPFNLPASDFPLLAGAALDDPGFLSLDVVEIPGEFEPLPAGTSVALKVLSTSTPDFKVWNPVGPGEPGFQILGDDVWVIGQPFFDSHPVWHIDTADPAFNELNSPWTVTFQVIDVTGADVVGLGPSDPITVAFTPEPAAAALLPLGLALLARRGRTDRQPKAAR